MKLRTAVFLVLFVFAFAPMAALVGLSLPTLLDSLEGLVYRGQLQRLQVEFADLQGFMTSRKEMVRVLAKLPEPDRMSAGPDPLASFIPVINRVLVAGQDIYEVVYFDREGVPRLRLARARLGEPLRPVSRAADKEDQFYLEVGLAMQADGVYISPLTFNPGTHRPEPHAMTLRLVSPIRAHPGNTTAGVVVATVDVGGLPQAYRNTLWVMNDGHYLAASGREAPGSAFEDFSGLEDLFVQGAPGLWQGPKGQRVIWLPLFPTERRGPLWVGRALDTSDVRAFTASLTEWALLVFVVLLVSVLLLARWVAQRVARYGNELVEGVGRVLDDEPGVVFSPRGVVEQRQFAKNLTRLADTHAHNTRDLLRRAAELEESNRYKSEFLANMSHELRTPLNSILLLSKMLAENTQGNLSSDQIKQLQVIHRAGSDLLALINDILDISKIEAKKVTVHLERLETGSFWRPALDLFQPLAREKGIEMTARVLPGTPATIMSDGDKLRQVLRNFLSNALKFTAQGRLELVLAPNPSGELPLKIEVRDSGIGIPQDKQAQIFEAFRQADGSTSRKYGGTGLGLAISREIVELLGGRIELESQEGQGSIFRILLPLEFDVQGADPEFVEFGGQRLPEPEPEPEWAAPQGPSEATPAPVDACQDEEAVLAGRRVLVVDADVRHLLELTRRLEGWQLAVTAAGGCAEALDTLEADAGFELAVVVGPADKACVDTVRALDARSLPVLMLNRSGATDGQSCAEAGARIILSQDSGDPVLHQALCELVLPE